MTRPTFDRDGWVVFVLALSPVSLTFIIAAIACR